MIRAILKQGGVMSHKCSKESLFPYGTPSEALHNLLGDAQYEECIVCNDMFKVVDENILFCPVCNSLPDKHLYIKKEK